MDRGSPVARRSVPVLAIGRPSLEEASGGSDGKLLPTDEFSRPPCSSGSRLPLALEAGVRAGVCAAVHGDPGCMSLGSAPSVACEQLESDPVPCRSGVDPVDSGDGCSSEIRLGKDCSRSPLSSQRTPSSFIGPVRCGEPVGLSSVSDGAPPVPDDSRLPISSSFQILASNFPPLPPHSKVSTCSADVALPLAFSASPSEAGDFMSKSSSVWTSPPLLSSHTQFPSPSEPLPKVIASPPQVGLDAECKLPSSWASKVNELPAVMELKYIKPVASDIEGKVRIKLPASVARKGASIWQNTIVGFFLDKLPFSLVQACAQRHWGKSGLIDVLCNGNGFFFFKFSDPVRVSDALEGGPWYFGGRPIFLKRWSPCMNLSKEGCKKVPIWAHFYNVPLEYWTEEGLSYIASMVGKPLHADKMTSSLRRLSYARICIEIDIDASLPKAFDLELEDGSISGIQIEYNWVPKRCSVCKDFGHLPSNCKKVSHQVWIPKSSHLNSKSVSDGDWQLVENHRRDVPILHSSPPKAQIAPPSKAQAVPNSMASPRNLSPARELRCSDNSFAALRSLEDRAAITGDIPSKGSMSTVIVDMAPADDPIYGSISPLAEGQPVSGEASPASGYGPSSPPSPSSSTPMLARKIIMVDEVEKKLGRKKKDKRKSGVGGSSSSSRGIPSLISR